MDKNKRIFPFVIIGQACSTPKEAQQSFWDEFDLHREYIKGFWYWRRLPIIAGRSVYPGEKEEFIIKARLYSSLVELKSHALVDFDAEMDRTAYGYDGGLRPDLPTIEEAVALLHGC